MPDDADTPRGPRFLGTDRVAAYSDAVLAIAATLLVLDIAVRPSGTPGGAAALLPLTAQPLGRSPNDAKDSSRQGHLARMIARAETQGASTSWQHSAECLRCADNVSTCLAQNTSGRWGSDVTGGRFGY